MASADTIQVTPHQQNLSDRNHLATRGDTRAGDGVDEFLLHCLREIAQANALPIVVAHPAKSNVGVIRLLSAWEVEIGEHSPDALLQRFEAVYRAVQSKPEHARPAKVWKYPERRCPQIERLVASDDAR